MKLQCDIEESIEHFTLIEDDLQVLAKKAGSIWLGCALLSPFEATVAQFLRLYSCAVVR